MVISVRSGATKHSTGSPGNQFVPSSQTPQSYVNFRSFFAFSSSSLLGRLSLSLSLVFSVYERIMEQVDRTKKKTHQYIPNHHLTLSLSLSVCFVTQQLLRKRREKNVKLLWNKKRKSFSDGKPQTHTHTQRERGAKFQTLRLLFYWKILLEFSMSLRSSRPPTIKNDNP